MEIVTQRRLQIVTSPGVNDPGDFTRLAECVRSLDATIDVAVLRDEPPEMDSELSTAVPTLTLSPAPVRKFRAARGPVFQGVLMPKSEEYRRLEAIGIPVPRWSRMTMNQVPDCAALGKYVIVKPDLGAQGADVRYARATRVRWKPPTTATARVLGGPFGAKLVQKLIYTGPWPVSYRVVTLFGQALWCLKIEASHGRLPLAHRHAFGELKSGTSVPIVSSGRECTFESSYVPEVLALGESAHRAFPEIGLLGVDVLREVDTDRLYVIEVNSLGYVWHVNSLKGRQLQAQFHIDIDSQWGVTPKAAGILVDAVRTRAA